MSQARDGHTGTLLSDGRVFVVGGNGTSGGLSLTSAEIYDPSSNSWSSAGNMLEGRSHHTAIQLNDGKVLIAGGLLGPENPLSTVDFYSPTTNSWSSAITNTQ
jgi:N-acetylneuraminic acid mutarotase